MNGEDYNYEGEILMGNWVRERCKARYDQLHKPMPADIVNWLKTAGSKSPADGGSDPTGKVLGWMVWTVIDPDWAE